MSEGGRYELRSRVQQERGRNALRRGCPPVVLRGGAGNAAVLWGMWQGGAGERGGEVLPVGKVPHAVYGSGLCYVPAAGGEGARGVAVTGGEKSRACWLWHLEQDEWEEVGELSAPRWGHGSVCVGGRLVVLGGALPHEWSGSVEWLDVAECTEWQPGPAAPHSLYCPKVAVLGSDVYVLDDYSGKFYCLHTGAGAGRWSCLSGLDEGGVGQRKPGLDGPVRGSSMTAVDGKIYVAGSQCRVYDVASDTWQAAAPPGHQHYYGSLVRWGPGTLLLAGGETDALDLYHVTTDTWTQADFKLPAKTSFGASLEIPN